MDKTKFSVATITWARDAGEAQLLRASLEILAALEIPVFITDGGSGPAFLDFLARFPHFSCRTVAGKGLWAQAHSSLEAAYDAGSRYILYTEPDKHDFFRDHLPAFLAAAPADDQAGVILASRSAGAFRTFPAFQQKTETAINQCCEEVMGLAADYTYGPFLLQRGLVPYLKAVPADTGWGWRPFAFGIAQRLGYPLLACPGDYACPPSQRADDPAERLYRIRQLQQNIQGLLLSTTASL